MSKKYQASVIDDLAVVNDLGPIRDQISSCIDYPSFEHMLKNVKGSHSSKEDEWYIRMRIPMESQQSPPIDIISILDTPDMDAPERPANFDEIVRHSVACLSLNKAPSSLPPSVRTDKEVSRCLRQIDEINARARFHQ